MNNHNEWMNDHYLIGSVNSLTVSSDVNKRKKKSNVIFVQTKACRNLTNLNWL